MRIGFEAKRLFLNDRGLGNYARNLLYGLVKYKPEHEYHLYTHKFLNIYMDDTKENSSRSYGCLVIVPCLSLDVQKDLVIRFNKLVKDYREKYHSLFLSNYRESKDICRKRISFDLVYKIVGYLLL